MYCTYIVKAQAAPKNQTLKLNLPYEAIPCTILCHTAQTSFLRRDFWYLNRAASSPRALLNPFAPFSAGQRIVYVLYEHSYRICVSLRLQNKFSIWLLAKASSLLAFCEHWTNFDCATTDLDRIGSLSPTVSASPGRTWSTCGWAWNIFGYQLWWLQARLPFGSDNFLMKFCGFAFDTESKELKYQLDKKIILKCCMVWPNLNKMFVLFMAFATPCFKHFRFAKHQPKPFNHDSIMTCLNLSLSQKIGGQVERFMFMAGKLNKRSSLGQIW